MRKGQRKRSLALCLAATMCINLLSMQQAPVGRAAESEQTTIESYGLSNPRVDNGVVTWDCICFGTYPQSEYVPKQSPENPVTGETYEDIDGTKMVYSEWKTLETVGGENKVVDSTPGYSKIEPIKWRVLSVEGDDAFLMADKALDCQQYNIKQSATSWETCTMRSWLNGYGADCNSWKEDYTGDGFVNSAFTETERQAIKTVPVVNTRNPQYYTDAGNDTQDQVYLLSYDELNASSYGFCVDEITGTREAEATDYAGLGGSILSPNVATQRAYWTRTPGQYRDKTCIVNGDNINHIYNATYTQMLVRPVLHLDLNASQGLWSEAGCVTVGKPSVTPTPSAEPTTEPTPTASVLPTLKPSSEPTGTPVVTASPSLKPSLEPTGTPAVATPTPTSVPAWLQTEIVYDAADMETFVGRTKAEAEKKYAEVKNAVSEYKESDVASFYEIQPSFTADYYPGTLSRDTLKAMISLCNYYRWLVGSEEAAGDTSQPMYIAYTWHEIQQQAYMCNFWAKPEDFPTEKWVRPNTSYYEFQQGNSPLEAIKNAVNTKCTSWDQNTYYTYDLRRDIIGPGKDVRLKMGYSGKWFAEQRIETYAVNGTNNRPAFYSYPSEGYMPNDLLAVEDTAWSVTVNRNYLTIPSGQDISIRISHRESGKVFKRSMKAENAYASYDNIIFKEPLIEGMSKYDGTYDVEIVGLLDVKTGKGAQICYTTTFFEASDISFAEEESGKEDQEKETASGNTAGTETADGNTAGTETADGNTAGTETASGNTAGTETADGNTAGTETASGNTAGTETADGNTAGTETANGNTAGTETAGGSTAGTETVGGNASGNGDADGDSSGTVNPAGETSQKAVKIPKVNRVKKIKIETEKNGVMVKWKKSPGISGYQIQLSRKKNFKGAKNVYRKKNATEYRIPGKKMRQRYYIRIRAYKFYRTNEGEVKKTYGGFSRIKKLPVFK